MEDDGMGEEAARWAKVPPSTLNPQLYRISISEFSYRQSKGEELQWSGDEDYRDYLPETEKDEFLKVPASNLVYFCCNHDPSGLSNAMLSDSVMFSKLYNTWQAYICPIPDCLCWFPEDDALVLHLINQHSHALPFLQQNPTEEQRCADALRSTVWKPIDARAAAGLLKFLYYHEDASLFDAHHLASLEWPLSKDLTRSKLLVKLQMEFEELLRSLERKSFALLSNGCLRALLAVASNDILPLIDPTNIAPPSFKSLLYCSPLSFRFMEEESLQCFLELVERIRNLVEDQASRSRELEGSRDGEIDAVSFAAGSEYFVLDGAKLNSCGIDEKHMGSWLFEAPYFPRINKFPTEAPEILPLVRRKAVSFSQRLTTVRGQSDLKLAALGSCLKMWNMRHWLTAIHDKSSLESASNSEYNTASIDDLLSPSCFSVRDPAKRQKTTKYVYQHYLGLIECTCELQFFELQLRRLCVIDLRTYILPLLKSYLRMKLYILKRLGFGSVTGDDVEEEHTDEGEVTDGSREEHSEEHSYCSFEEETTSGDDSDVMTPDKELHTALPELGSGGSCITDDSPMMIDGGGALGGDPPNSDAEDADCRAPQVGCADAAPSRSRTCTGVAIAKSEAKREGIMESGAEPETQCSQEFTGSPSGSLSYYFNMDSDFDGLSKSEEEFEDRLSKEFSDFARRTNESGLFVRMTINDVVNYCLEQEPTRSRDDAMNIWGLKTNPLNYWRCFVCEKRFPDQESHMLHLESYHDLGISWDPYWFVPSQVQQEGGSGVNEGVKERTRRLDDSITVDCSYRAFVVEMEKIQNSYQNEDEGKARDVNQFELIVGRIKREICCLRDMIYAKYRRCLPFEIIGLDAEVAEKFARLKRLKQELSDLCISDYKNEIVLHISSFLKKRNLLDSGSWALERLKILLGSVESSWHPDSFSIQLESPGKVTIDINEHTARIGFAYFGIRLKFAGDLSGKGSRNIKGTFLFSGTSDSNDNIDIDTQIILDIGEQKMTRKLVWFKEEVASCLTWGLVGKLKEFQAEVRTRSQCEQRKQICLYGLEKIDQNDVFLYVQ